MRVLRNFLAFLIIMAESVILSHFICAEGTETSVFIVLSFCLNIFTIYALHDINELPLFILGIVIALVVAPLITVFLTLPVELFIKILGIFGIKGTARLAVVVSFVIGILSNCVFIFFF